MNGTMQQLVDFIVGISYEDMPAAVQCESKRVLLDSIGVAIAGLATDKGKYSVELSRRLGGPPESTILGIGDRLSCVNAGFANGELINALDMDATLMPGHVTPYVLPAPLALAESVRASGKELLVAIVLAHEIAARVGRALTAASYMTELLGREEAPFAPMYNFNVSIFGGAAGAGKILRLNQEKMAQALGIVSYSAPVPASLKWARVMPAFMLKYAPSGWMAQAEINSVLLAQMGYTGDTSVLDGEYGFWKFMPNAQWDPGRLTGRLGERWSFLATHYKPYPCCRVMHSGLDGFTKIIDENNLYPEDIEQVRVFLDPTTALPLWQNREIGNQVDAQFSVPYVFAAAAHRIRLGPDWQDSETIKNPKVLEFMKKVSVGSHPEFNKTFKESPRTELSLVEVVAKGQTFRQETMFAKGTHSPEAFRLTDEELAEKFRNNASRMLPGDKIEKAVESIFELERIEDVNELIKLVVM